MSEPAVLIIGGGVGGLACAIRLASKGIPVRLFEKGPRVGGKLNLITSPHPNRRSDNPFRFDTGPSLITLPFVFEQLFHAAGRSIGQYLRILPLDPIQRFIWPDGATLQLHHDPDRLRDSLQQFAPNDVDGFFRFLARGSDIWNRAGEMFLFNAPEQLMNRPGGKPWDGLKMLAVPFQIGMFQRYRVLVDRHVRHPRLRELLYQYATYSGASPFKAPATLGVIPFAEQHFGGHYIDGGMYRLAEALETLARELGVQIELNAPVEKIVIENGQARGVIVNGSRLDASAVVCNADVVYAYRNLIDAPHRPHFDDRKLNRLEPGGSGMVLLLGVEGTYPQLAHHTKFMPADYRSDLRAMFETGTIPDDPCLYVCATTRTDPSQAPAGCENLFVLTSAPPLTSKIDWSIEGPRYEARVLERLEARGLTNLRNRIVVKHRLTPADLQSRYNANAGSIYGISSNSLRTAFLRPPNRDKHIRNLYFAGGATHPGGGLPLVTLSGKIASEMVLEDRALSTDAI